MVALQLLFVCKSQVGDLFLDRSFPCNHFTQIIPRTHIVIAGPRTQAVRGRLTLLRVGEDAVEGLRSIRAHERSGRFPRAVRAPPLRRKRFADFQRPSRNGPFAARRFVAAPDQQHAPTVDHHVPPTPTIGSSGNSRVRILFGWLPLDRPALYNTLASIDRDP